MKDIIIRKTNPQDKKQIFELFETVLTDTFINNNIYHLKEDLAEELQDKKDAFNNKKNHHFMVAQYNDRIIACIEYCLNNDLINKLTDNKYKDNYEIGTVYVHPEYQKQGIVNLMLKSLMNEMLDKEINTFFLDCGFPVAQKIWTKKFGEPQLIFKNYWGLGSDHCIWILDTKTALKIINTQN